MKRRIVIGLSILAAGAAAIGWYIFRPERLFLDDRVNETFPVAARMEASAAPAAMSAPTVLARGDFHSNAHETSGAATIYRLDDGQRVLRLSDFETSNGPDVRVYLVAAEDVTDDATVERAGFVELGKLKGNVGAQNYVVPPDVDLGKYRAVTIWCRRFSVNFGTAPLGSSIGG